MDTVWVLAPASAGMDTTAEGVVGNAGNAAYVGMSFGNHDRAEGGVRTAEEANMVYQVDGVHCAAEPLAGPEASLEVDDRSSVKEALTAPTGHYRTGQDCCERMKNGVRSTGKVRYL